jgi:hypothetical protein
MAARFRLGTEVDGGEALETGDGLLYAARTSLGSRRCSPTASKPRRVRAG